MKIQVYFAIAWRLIFLCLIGITLSYVTPYMRDFFGDIPIQPHPYDIIGIDPYYNWGARHYWYFFTMFLLFD